MSKHKHVDELASFGPETPNGSIHVVASSIVAVTCFPISVYVAFMILWSVVFGDDGDFEQWTWMTLPVGVVVSVLAGLSFFYVNGSRVLDIVCIAGCVLLWIVIPTMIIADRYYRW